MVAELELDLVELRRRTVATEAALEALRALGDAGGARPRRDARGEAEREERPSQRSPEADAGALVRFCARDGCGQSFEPRRADQRFCTPKCRQAVRSAIASSRQKATPHDGTIPCARPSCSNMVPAGKLGRARFCSRACGIASAPSQQRSGGAAKAKREKPGPKPKRGPADAEEPRPGATTAAAASWKPQASARPKPAPILAVAPLLLAAVPVGALESVEQRFKCVPFSATISAATCVDRQRIAGGKTAARQGDGATVHRLEMASLARRYERCRDCALGRQVAERVAPGSKASQTAS